MTSKKELRAELAVLENQRNYWIGEHAYMVERCKKVAGERDEARAKNEELKEAHRVSQGKTRSANEIVRVVMRQRLEALEAKNKELLADVARQTLSIEAGMRREEELAKAFRLGTDKLDISDAARLALIARVKELETQLPQARYAALEKRAVEAEAKAGELEVKVMVSVGEEWMLRRKWALSDAAVKGWKARAEELKARVEELKAKVDDATLSIEAGLRREEAWKRAAQVEASKATGRHAIHAECDAFVKRLKALNLEAE